jgi:transposase-like protein
MPKKPKTKVEEIIELEPVDEPSKGGRPTLYRPEYCDVVRDLALLGLKDDEIAGQLEVDPSTIHNWKKAHPEFKRAIQEGKTPADGTVVRKLYERANGYVWTEEQAVKIKEIEYDANGKKIRETERVEVVEVTRRAPPDTTAAIFWLKNRRSTDWRDRKEVEIGRPGEFDQMAHEELVDYILGEAKELGLELPQLPKPTTKGKSTKH